MFQLGRAPTPHPMTKGQIPDLWIDPDYDDKRTVATGISELRNNVLLLDDCVQTVLNVQPLYNASGINGLGAIEAETTSPNKRITSSNPATGFPFSTRVIFVQCVVDISALPGGNGDVTLIALVSSGGRSSACRIINDGGGLQGHVLCRHFNGAAIVDTISSDSPVTLGGGNAFIFTWIYDVGVTQGQKMRINGVEQTITSNATLVGVPSVLNITLMNAGSMAQACSGLMGYFGYTNVVPPIEIIEWRERFLANRYGIPI